MSRDVAPRQREASASLLDRVIGALRHCSKHHHSSPRSPRWTAAWRACWTPLGAGIAIGVGSRVGNTVAAILEHYAHSVPGLQQKATETIAGLLFGQS